MYFFLNLWLTLFVSCLRTLCLLQSNKDVFFCFPLLKTKQAQNGVTYAKPHITRLQLNYSFGLSQRRNPKLASQESPTSTHWAVCPTHPLVPWRDVTAPFYLRHCCLIRELYDKRNEIFNTYSVAFCFLTPLNYLFPFSFKPTAHFMYGMRKHNLLSPPNSYSRRNSIY